jgi:hypothetical protein
MPWCLIEYKDILTYGILLIGKDKAIPIQAWTGPYGCRRLRLSEFLDGRQMKVVSLSVLDIDGLYPQEITRYLFL